MTPQVTISDFIFALHVVVRIWNIPSYKGKFGMTPKVTIFEFLFPLDVAVRICGIP